MARNKTSVKNACFFIYIFILKYIYSTKGAKIMGSAIINAIKSGLGLIGDLATEFLNGFSTLFWDATANQGAGALTTFGTYSLVMLGIAVTFAVISLVLGVLRGNSGV